RRSGSSYPWNRHLYGVRRRSLDRAHKTRMGCVAAARVSLAGLLSAFLERPYPIAHNATRAFEDKRLGLPLAAQVFSAVTLHQAFSRIRVSISASSCRPNIASLSGCLAIKGHSDHRGGHIESCHRTLSSHTGFSDPLRSCCL